MTTDSPEDRCGTAGALLGAHVWWLCCDRVPAQIAGTALAEAENRRAGSLRLEADRLAYRTAHRLLRWALDRVRPDRAGTWSIDHDERGKLFQTDDPDLAVSLSHSHRTVAAAIGIGVEVGVDVEEGAAPDWRHIARAICRPGERRSLERLAEADRETAFLRLWTAKEAWGKALGTGLSASAELPELDYQDGAWRLPGRLGTLLQAPCEVPLAFAAAGAGVTVVWHPPSP